MSAGCQFHWGLLDLSGSSTISSKEVVSVPTRNLQEGGNSTCRLQKNIIKTTYLEEWGVPFLRSKRCCGVFVGTSLSRGFIREIYTLGHIHAVMFQGMQKEAEVGGATQL